MIDHLRTIPVEFFWLFGALVVLLGVASGVAALLSRRPADEKKAASRVNLTERINAWWVMVGILAVAFLTGPTMTLILFALASFFALREFITLTPSRPGDRLPLSLAFFLVLPLQFVLIGTARYGSLRDLHPRVRVPAAAIDRGLALRHRRFPARAARSSSGASWSPCTA